MKRSITAAVWNGAGIELQSFDRPTVMNEELLVRIDLATVCGSDRHTVSGRRQCPTPGILGHEAVGTVEEGSRAGGITAGSKVVWGVTVPCHQCGRCRAGHTAKCERVKKVGHEPLTSTWPLSGAYASHILLPREATIVEVPQALDDQIAAPAACATATVMAAVEAAGDLDGRHILICGAGMLGVTASAFASLSGAASVTVTDPQPERRTQALRFGATAAIGPDDELKPVDVAFEFSGASAAAQIALNALAPFGTLVLVGSVAPDHSLSVDPERIVRGWLTVTGVHNYEPRHLREAVAFLDSAQFDFPWAELVAPPLPLSSVAKVFTETSAFARVGLSHSSH